MRWPDSRVRAVACVFGYIDSTHFDFLLVKALGSFGMLSDDAVSDMIYCVVLLNLTPE